MDTEAIWQAIGAYGNARWRGMSHEIDAADHLSEITRLLLEAEKERSELLKENERLNDEVDALKKDSEELTFLQGDLLFHVAEAVRNGAATFAIEAAHESYESWTNERRNNPPEAA